MAKKTSTSKSEIAIAKSVDAVKPKGKADANGRIPAGKTTVYDPKTGAFVDRAHLARFAK